MSSEKIIDDAIQAIVDGVYDSLKREAAKLSYDLTKTARVSAVLPGNFYQVEMDGKVYNAPSHTFVSLNIGDIVDVKIPQNNYSKLYIEGLSSGNPDKQERDLEALTEPFRKALTIDIDTNCIVIPCDADGVPETKVDVVMHSYGTRGGEDTSDYTISLEGSHTGIQATVNNATKTVTFSIPERTITEKIPIEELNMYTLNFKDNQTGWQVTKIVNVNGIYKGQTGEDGVTQYVHIAYSAYANGREFTDEPNLTVHKYMGVATTTSPTFPTRADSFKWSLIQGADGQTYYTWIKYANSASPASADLSDSPDNMSYIGIATNKEVPEEESTDSTDPKQYKWSRLQGYTGDPGKDGADGTDGKTYYTWIKYSNYANPTSGQMSDSPDGQSYIGIAANMESSVESNNPSDYNWALIKGADGTDGKDGADGQDGADGEDAITYWMVVSAASIKEAVDGTYTPTSIELTGKSKKGSNSPANYSCRFRIERTIDGTTWNTVYNSASNETNTSYLVPANTKAVRCNMYDAGGTTLLLDQKIIPVVIDGIPGQDGADGSDGQTYYTWIKYSSVASPTSAQMSDSPSNAIYIGIATNKLSATESTNPNDYTWSRFRGEDGEPGQDGADGAPGKDGVDGADAVTYWMILSAASVKKDIDGIYTPATLTLSGKSQIGDSDPSDYKCRFKIETTTNGTTWSSVYTSSSDESSKSYNIPSGITALRCNMYYAGGTSLLLDQKIIPIVEDGAPGQDGVDGEPGKDGADGQTYYTWIKYANSASPTSAQMSDSPTNMTHMGIATGKTTAVESSNPGDYSWTQFRGDDGKDGLNGADAITYWMVVSAASIKKSVEGVFTPSSINLIGKSQIGSSDLSDYNCRFKIERSTNGTTWSSVYTSSADENNKSYSVTSGTVALRCSMYMSGGTSILLDQKIIPVVNDGTPGQDGKDGIDGQDGQTYYTWIKYSAYASPSSSSQISDSPTNMTYIGIATDKTSATESTNPGDYVWTRFRGEDGIDGDPGKDGADGKDAITYWMVASAASINVSVSGVCTPSSVTLTGKSKIGDSSPSDYKCRFKIEKTTNGNTWSSVYTSSVDESSISYTVPTDTAALRCSMYSAGGTTLLLDQKVIPTVNDGEPGQDGSDGADGKDGQTYYTWIKYSNYASPTSAQISDSPTGMSYIGIAANKTSPTESTTPGDYSWSKFKGESGADGSDGQDAVTYWMVVSAASINKSVAGAYTPPSITLTGKSQTGSGTPSDYSCRFKIESTSDGNTWSTSYSSTANQTTTTFTIPSGVTAIRCNMYAAGGTSLLLDQKIVPIVIDGTPGENGTDGKDGQTYYTWIKYSTVASPTSSQMSDSPSGMYYIGIAANKTSATESTTPGDYAWSRFRGEDGADGATGEPGKDGADAITYWMIASAASIRKSVTGSFTPATIDLTGKSKIGDNSPANYNCRFKIERTVDGSTWSTVYTSSTNEASKSYNVTLGTMALRCSMYLAGGTSLLLDQKIIPVVNDGEPGADGADGTNGTDGQTYYTWIKYSNYSSPTSSQISDSPSGMSYIGIASNKTSSTESTNPSDYTWAKFKGETGATGATGAAGTNGQDGTDGADAVTYWMIASAASVNKSVAGAFTPSSITLTGKSQIGNNSPASYNCRFKIERTTDGINWTTVYTSSSNQSSTSYSVTSDTTALRCNMYLAGGTTVLLDQKIIPIVSDGAPGQDGTNGTDGQTYYTWIKYSNYASPTSSQISDSPTNASYIGIAANKTSATESSNPSDYTWAKFRGEDGANGTDGLNGADAITYWMIVSAASINKSVAGEYNPSSISLIGKSQIGDNSPSNYSCRFKVETTTDGATWTSVYNSSTNESNKSYSIPAGITAIRCSMYAAGGTSLLLDQKIIPIVNDGTPGTDGKDGADGQDGKTYYTWIKYSNYASPTSEQISDSPTNMSYIGIATGKTSSTESTTPTDYAWTKFKGEDGADGADGQDGDNAVSYWMITSAASINKSATGTYTPSVITLSGKSQVGNSSPSEYKCRFTIETTANGDTWGTTYTSSSDQSSTSYTVPSGITAIRCNMYLAGNTNLLLDQKIIPIVNDGTNGSDGTDGAPGKDGQTYYTWIKYSNYASPTSSQISDSPTDMTYIGIATNKTSSVESTTPSDYSWSRFRGIDGADGADGDKGADAITYWMIVSSASIKRGIDNSFTPSFIGLTGKSQIGSNSPTDYNCRFKIEQTIDGSTWTTVYTSLSNESSKSYSIAANTLAIRCSMYLAGGNSLLLDQKIVPVVDDGTPGTDGIDGVDGVDGQTYYTWIKYSNYLSPTSAQVSDDPSGMSYIGIAANKTSSTESTDPNDYTWSKFKGEDGNDGADGLNGADAVTYWMVASAASIKQSVAGDFTPSSVTLTGKSKIGNSSPANYSCRFVIQRTTNGTRWTSVYTSSSNETTKSYSIPSGTVAIRCDMYLAGGTTTLLDQKIIPVVQDGTPGQDGADGQDGQTYYTWIKYSNYSSPTSAQMSDSPSGMTYIGIATDKTSATESTVPGDYTWTRFRGEDGADGADGIPGQDGVDGADAIAYWMVASAASIKKSVAGAFTPSSVTLTGKSQVGDSSPSDYSCRFKIERTTNGSSWSTVQTSSSDVTSTSYTITANTVAIRCSMYVAGGTTLLLDQKIIPVVSDGEPGQDGADGTDGQTYYTWIKYSSVASPTSAQMSDSPTGMSYIGIATNKTSSTESTTPGDYTWSKFRGDDGNDGAPGADGQDGVDGADATTYWMIVSAAAIGRSKSGVLSPGSVTLLAQSQTGINSPESCLATFKIETSTNGTTWTSATTASDKSSLTYALPTNSALVSVRCSMYKTINGTEVLLDQRVIPIVDDGIDGSDSTSYWMICSANSIKKDVYGVYSPDTVTLTGMSKSGNLEPAPYAGFFVIYYTTDGVNWLPNDGYYNTEAATTYSYTVVGNPIGLKCQMYLDIDRTILLDEQNVAVVSDGTESYMHIKYSAYLGGYTPAGEPSMTDRPVMEATDTQLASHYIGLATTSSALAPEEPRSYTWSTFNIKEDITASFIRDRLNDASAERGVTHYVLDASALSIYGAAFKMYTAANGKEIFGVDANGSLVLGNPSIENNQKLKMTSEGLHFVTEIEGQSDLDLAYFEDDEFYITNGVIKSRLDLGNFSFIPRGNGNMSLIKTKEG